MKKLVNLPWDIEIKFLGETIIISDFYLPLDTKNRPVKLILNDDVSDLILEHLKNKDKFNIEYKKYLKKLRKKRIRT